LTSVYLQQFGTEFDASMNQCFPAGGRHFEHKLWINLCRHV